MKIAAYVMDAYAKSGRVGTRVGARGRVAKDCHERRAWPGFEMVIDAISRAGYVVEYAGRATAHEFDVVLVSITSDCDWWPFVAERATWKPGKPLVIAGGAGVLNVRPFLQWISAFVLGRGEYILPLMIDAHVKGERYESESVVWSDSFDISRKYSLAQVSEPYPHEFLLTNRKRYREGSIGCPNRCLFCGYTWHRRYIGDGTFRASDGAGTGGSSTERTIADLLALPPARWQDDGPLGMVGLDGTSERMRRKANKPITREMLRAFLRGLSTLPNAHQVKLYCIVGYPEETDEDWNEIVEDISDVDSKLPKTAKQWSLLVHFTPFRAMPATPAACWPMSLRNYRGVIAAKLKRPYMPGNVFYQGNTFWAVEGLGTDSLPTVIQSAVCLRGTEADSEAFRRVACAPKYASACGKDKEATLRSVFDVVALFERYTWETLPTRYLTLRKHGA